VLDLVKEIIRTLAAPANRDVSRMKESGALPCRLFNPLFSGAIKSLDFDCGGSDNESAKGPDSRRDCAAFPLATHVLPPIPPVTGYFLKDRSIRSHHAGSSQPANGLISREKNMPIMPIRVLLIEDSQLDALLAIEVLKGGPGFQVVHRKTLAEVTGALSARSFDVVLVDLGLPDSEGLATAAAVMEWGPALPIIILTGNDDDAAARQAIKLGAQDYLVKGKIVPDLFYRSIRYSIERKKTEQALKESEAFLRRSQEIAHIGSWRFHFDSQELDWSQEVFRILGMEPGSRQVDYQLFRERIYPEDREAVDLFYSGGEGQADAGEIVHRIRKVDGTLRTIREKKERAEGTGAGNDLVGTFHDITDALALEEKYFHAQKMEAIGTLAGGIAHDFNNILTSILGYADLARIALDENVPAQEDLAQVIIAATRAKDLVRQILDFSRKSEQDMQPVATHLIVREALRLLRASLPENVEIRQRVATRNTTVLCNPTRFHQVVMNLCTNAFQAMPQGGRLEVRLEPVAVNDALRSRYPELLENTYLRLMVIDTGHGIHTEELGRVFDPYYSTKEAGQGTGLGLSVVHGIVSQLGGTVRVESEPERGSCFSVYLPLIDEDEGIKAERIAGPLEAVGGGNILYVDNEEAIAVLGKKILEPYGYDVTCCSSGIDALTLFSRDPSRFDLVITDYSMPQIMGTRLIGEIRRIRPEIPAILVSGLIDRNVLESGQTQTIDAILEKPLDREVLARTVQHILG
jgi:signal transduction histidine kinase